MAAATYSLEVFISERERGRELVPGVPLLAAVPEDGWKFNEGELRWIIEGTALLDREFGLYPVDQIDAVLSVVEAALARQTAELKLPGSIVRVLTEPVDEYRARFTLEIPRRRIAPGTHSTALHREVVGNIRKTARSVLDAIASMLAHLDAVVPAPPRNLPRPQNAGRNSLGQEFLDRVDGLESKYTAFIRPPPKRRG